MISDSPGMPRGGVGSIAAGPDVRWYRARECLLFQAHVGVQVHLRGLHGLVAEPQGDDGAIDAMPEEIHGRSVAKDMRRHTLAFE